jgi:hypothetical protein
MATATCWPQPGREGRWPAFPLVSLGVEPPPESNRRPHPYHRCAGGSRRRSEPHVPPHPRRWEVLPTVVSWGVARLRVARFLAISGTRSNEQARRPTRGSSPERGQPVASDVTGRPNLVVHPGALLSSDDFGSSVELTAKLHPLWRGAWRGIAPDGSAINGMDSKGVVALDCLT